MKGSLEEKVDAAKMAIKMIVRCAEDHTCPEEVLEIAVEDAHKWIDAIAEEAMRKSDGGKW